MGLDLPHAELIHLHPVSSRSDGFTETLRTKYAVFFEWSIEAIRSEPNKSKRLPMFAGES